LSSEDLVRNVMALENGDPILGRGQGHRSSPTAPRGWPGPSRRLIVQLGPLSPESDDRSYLPSRVLNRRASERDQRFSDDLIRNGEPEIVAPEEDRASMEWTRVPPGFGDENQQAYRFRCPAAVIEGSEQSPPNVRLHLTVRRSGTYGMRLHANPLSWPAVNHHRLTRWDTSRY
jgi:hypothetical protein